MSSPNPIRIVDDLSEAQALWERLSPKKTIYDDWRFRLCFHQYHQKDLRFYVGYDNNTPIGLLPLQYDRERECLEFWGGTYMEDNGGFVAPGYAHILPDMYQHIRRTGQRAVLEYIRGDDPFTQNLPLQDYKYVLPLRGIHSFEDYLTKYLDGEARGKWRRKVRKVEREQNEIIRNNQEDLELLFCYNMDAFGADSSFNDRPHHKEIFRDLLRLPYDIFLLTFVINGQKQAVSLCIMYNGVYEYFNLGVRTDAVPGLSTVVTKKNMELAIDAGATLFDAFVGDYGWKEHWRFEKIPQYRFDTLQPKHA